MKKQLLIIQLATPVITIAFTRLLLLATWNAAFMAGQKADWWHHMYTGVILVLISYAFSMKNKHIIRGIGIGLFIDELVHILQMLGFTNGNDYWSWQSWAALFFGIIIYVSIILWKNKTTNTIAKKEVF